MSFQRHMPQNPNCLIPFAAWRTENYKISWGLVPPPPLPPHQMLILCKACITNAKVPILGTLFLTFASIQQRCDYKGSVNSRLHYLAHLSRLDWFNMEMFDFFPRLSRLLKMNNFFRSEEGPKGRHSRPGSWTPESFVSDTHLSRRCRVTPRPLSGFDLEEDCFAMLCWAQVNHVHTYMCIGMKCVCIYPFPLEPPSPVPSPRSSQSVRLSALSCIEASRWAPCFTPGSVYMSAWLPQSVPSSPSPAVSTSPFSVSASPFLPCK